MKGKLYSQQKITKKKVHIIFIFFTLLSFEPTPGGAIRGLII